MRNTSPEGRFGRLLCVELTGTTWSKRIVGAAPRKMHKSGNFQNGNVGIGNFQISTFPPKSDLIYSQARAHF